MKLTSLLLGDIADLFQDSDIQNAAASAQAASSAARRSQEQTGRLAETIEQRIREVERENTILSTLLVLTLKHLSQSQPEETQKIVDEAAEILKPGIPTSSNILRQMLDLPPEPRTPIRNYLYPSAASGPFPHKPKPQGFKKME